MPSNFYSKSCLAKPDWRSIDIKVPYGISRFAAGTITVRALLPAGLIDLNKTVLIQNFYDVT